MHIPPPPAPPQDKLWPANPARSNASRLHGALRQAREAVEPHRIRSEVDDQIQVHDQILAIILDLYPEATS